MFLKRLFFHIRIPLAMVILFFVAVFYFPFPAVGKTMLLASEVLPQFPLKPLKLVTPTPVTEAVKIKTPSGEIEADLYRPQDKRTHPAVIFTIGIGITRKHEQVVGISGALARLGFIVLTPDVPDMLDGFVWRDSVETLIASVQYLENQEYVDKKSIGFAGFCVGSSAAMIAAENPAIADKVSYISAISPYYDMRTGSEAVITNHARNSKGELIEWQAAPISKEAVTKGFIFVVEDENEKRLLRAHFLEGKELTQEEINAFSQGALSVYNFLSNKDPARSDEIWAGFSEDYKKIGNEFSPSTKIANLKAKVLVLNDKRDTFVPRIEGEKLALSLPKDRIDFVEVDSFEHVNPSTKLRRWAAVKGVFQLGFYLYKIFSAAKIG